ncbi:peptidoglycan DD-metalloendopeptidase family protein [Streptomyces sp. NPDC018031]|uniref:M23 family metallopeptidase n=1 Tax=Streptomyces sp. NPDC018031 TaxID=3365033 RepID=UPI0037B93367
MPPHGRHRRYRPARISRASLGVTGAGLALPLLGATPAEGAAAGARDGVADHESAGDRSTGGGISGGPRSAREADAGTAYAPRAGAATREQRAAIAERAPAGPPGADGVSAVPGTAPAGERRTPSPDPAPTSLPGTATTTAGPYVVVDGDSLSRIAHRHGVDGGWQALHRANRETVGADPDLIFPGQRLSLTGTTARPDTPPGRAGRPSGVTAREPGANRSAEPAARPKPKPAPETAPGPAPDAKTEPADAGFTAPVDGVSPSTAYRTAGSHWSSGYHTGVDFPVPVGTSVRSVRHGRVVSAGWADAYGYEVIVRHPDGGYSQYAHLSQLSVRTGQQVTTGQRIGRSGSTGNSTGPHLHFEVRTGPGYGSDVDPLGYLRAHGVRI